MGFEPTTFHSALPFGSTGEILFQVKLRHLFVISPLSPQRITGNFSEFKVKETINMQCFPGENTSYVCKNTLSFVVKHSL